MGLIPGSGRSSGEVNGNTLQNSHLENPMDRGAWWVRSIGSQRVGHDRGTKHAKPYSRVKPKFGETKHEIYEKDVFFRQFIYS